MFIIGVEMKNRLFPIQIFASIISFATSLIFLSAYLKSSTFKGFNLAAESRNLLEIEICIYLGVSVMFLGLTVLIASSMSQNFRRALSSKIDFHRFLSTSSEADLKLKNKFIVEELRSEGRLICRIVFSFVIFRFFTLAYVIYYWLSSGLDAMFSWMLFLVLDLPISLITAPMFLFASSIMPDVKLNYFDFAQLREVRFFWWPIFLFGVVGSVWWIAVYSYIKAKFMPLHRAG